ncbi:MAG: Rpn family recombination-promoting nuclease/putative transposase [Cuspidothrix sp.]
MTENIDHDRLFKELISTFFLEFIELFFPQVLEYIDTESIVFLDKEIFTDVTAGDKYETDLIVKVKFLGQASYFVIHIEAESGARPKFNKRMFRYFARLDEKLDLPIYPIVIFSYESPKTLAVNNYQINFPDFQVLKFNYQVVQLNQLNWRDFLTRQNPVASALMSKMNIEPEDRPKVKAECLRLLVTLKLNPVKMQLISGFIDTYLRLNKIEEEKFKTEIGTLVKEEKEEVMQIVTSWMEEGIERGIERGIDREKNLIIRQINRKFGQIDRELETELRSLNIEIIEALGEAIFDLDTVEDLKTWLDNL